MSSIKVPDIKAGDRFWHNGELYTATSDAAPYGGRDLWFGVPTDVGTLRLHRSGAVLRAGRNER